MAFATSNPRSGGVGDLKVYAGQWSGAVGDAAGSVTLKGGIVYFCRFENQDNDTGKWNEAATSISVSSGTITVTVNNHEAVTNGRFIIIFA